MEVRRVFFSLTHVCIDMCLYSYIILEGLNFWGTFVTSRCATHNALFTQCIDDYLHQHSKYLSDLRQYLKVLGQVGSHVWLVGSVVGGGVGFSPLSGTSLFHITIPPLCYRSVPEKYSKENDTGRHRAMWRCFLYTQVSSVTTPSKEARKSHMCVKIIRGRLYCKVSCVLFNFCCKYTIHGIQRHVNSIWIDMSSNSVLRSEDLHIQLSSITNTCTILPV